MYNTRKRARDASPERRREAEALLESQAGSSSLLLTAKVEEDKEMSAHTPKSKRGRMGGQSKSKSVGFSSNTDVDISGMKTKTKGKSHRRTRSAPGLILAVVSMSGEGEGREGEEERRGEGREGERRMRRRTSLRVAAAKRRRLSDKDEVEEGMDVDVDVDVDVVDVVEVEKQLTEAAGVLTPLSPLSISPSSSMGSPLSETRSLGKRKSLDGDVVEDGDEGKEKEKEGRADGDENCLRVVKRMKVSHPVSFFLLCFAFFFCLSLLGFATSRHLSFFRSFLVIY